MVRLNNLHCRLQSKTVVNRKRGLGGSEAREGGGRIEGEGEVKVREGWGGEGGAQNRQVRSFQHRPIHICYTYIAISTIYYRMWDEAQRKHRGRAQYFGCNILFWIKKKKNINSITPLTWLQYRMIKKKWRTVTLRYCVHDLTSRGNQNTFLNIIRKETSLW